LSYQGIRNLSNNLHQNILALTNSRLPLTCARYSSRSG